MIDGAYAAAQRSARTRRRAALGEARKEVNVGADPDGIGLGERATGRRAAW
ncbi:hypothetical protein GCM10009838_24080 [Catenulispora subtropica]|uniref:Uncharacterized protein n=1 Tax=Catenulispora subtropica TaxID=450798 RepID=A0ABN2R9D4_9ACTN